MKINLDLFDSSPFPLDYPVVNDSFRFESEGIATEGIFHEKRIKDITAEVMVDAFKETDLGALPYCMTDRAFVFFLPALMQASIDGEEDTNDSLHDNNKLGDLSATLIGIFKRMAEEMEKNHKFMMLNAVYSHEQKREIARFLVEMRNANNPLSPARVALQKYWGQYL